jgi:hypothetical protein
LPDGGEVEVLAGWAVEDGFDLSSGHPDADGAGFYACGAGGFPEVAEVAAAFELGEVDFYAVWVGVGDHVTSSWYEKAPDRCVHGGGLRSVL